jgi:dihydrofolate reductase
LIISIIVAIGQQRQIGLAGQMPWRLPADLRNFKNFTMNHHLLMGRVTFDSIGKTLPGRKMVVLTQNENLSLPEVKVCTTWEQSLTWCREQGEAELFVAGGAKIYQLALPSCHRLYLTEVDYAGPADTFFPAYQQYSWKTLREASYPGENARPAWKFSIMEKKT